MTERHLKASWSGTLSARGGLASTQKWIEFHGSPHLLISHGTAALEPRMLGLMPIPAVNQALARAGWKLADVERIETNEAFGAIAIAVASEFWAFAGHSERRERRYRSRASDRRHRRGPHD